MSKISNLFIKRLKVFMAEKDWDQTVLAKQSGIARPQLNNYLKEKNEPGLEVVEKIAEAIGRPVTDFFKDEITLTSRSIPPDIEEGLYKADETQLNGVRGALGIPQKPRAGKKQEDVG